MHYRPYWLLFDLLKRKPQLTLYQWNKSFQFSYCIFCANGAFHPIKLAPVYNSVFHIQMTTAGQGENINKRVFERLCQVKDLWTGFPCHCSVQALGICASPSGLILALKQSAPGAITAPYPSLGPILLVAFKLHRFEGWQGEPCFFTLISDALSPSLFKKEGHFLWQTQTFQETNTHWLTHEVDLKPVHIWVG